MNQAEQLKEVPTPEVEKVLATLADASTASGSMCTAEWLQDDGSRLVASSFQGSDPELHTFEDGENPVVAVPVPEGATPEPQGIQENGVNAYDETGPPEGLTDEEAI